MNFGENRLFSNVNVAIEKGEKVALVGANGSGKTTLLKIVSGELEASQGEIEFFGERMGFIKQFRVEKDRTLYEEGLSVFKEALEAYEKAVKSAEKIDLESYEYHLQRAEMLDVYSADKKVRKMLKGVGFEEKDFHRRLSTLSAGEVTRLQLAKLLSSEPDLLVLDEPGNYLDVYSMIFLKKALLSLKSAVLMATHDRQMMSEVVDCVWDLDFQTVKVYKGDYNDFLRQKSLYVRSVKNKERNLSKEIKRLENVVDRYKKWGREKAARQAKSKERELKLLIKEKEKLRLEEKKKVKVRFSSDRTSEDIVLDVNDLEVHAGEKYIGKFTFNIKNGEHVALIGKNGVGKTSLLKAIIKGKDRVKFGPNVKFAYVDTVGGKRSGNSLLSLTWEIVPKWEDYEVRKYLGRFGFNGEDVFKSENSLSGGEFVRFELARALLKKPNFLILDEPTNHLDVYMIESLEGNLKSYEGTLLFSTHDLEFARSVAKRFFVMDGKILRIFDDYDETLKHIQEKMGLQNSEARHKRTDVYARRKAVKNRLKSLEDAIKRCEEDFEQLSKEMKKIENDMELNSVDHLKLEELERKRQKTERMMEELLEKIEIFEKEKKKLEEEVKW